MTDSERILMLLRALKVVADWKLPPSDRTFPDGTVMTYETAYGSNGARIYMREQARAAIDKVLG